MNQKHLNMILVACISILIFVNMILYLNLLLDLYNFGDFNVVIAGIFYCEVSYILLVVIVVLYLLIIENKIGKKSLSIITLILFILLFGYLMNSILSSPVGGTKLYDYAGSSSNPKGSTRIFENYVTWRGDNEVYLMNIDEKTPTKIGTALNGPAIYEKNVYFENDNIIYQYNISTKNIIELTNGSGSYLEAIKDNIIWYEGQSFIIYNIKNEEKTSTEVKNITFPFAVNNNYIVWKERVGNLTTNDWEFWIGMGNPNVYEWLKSGIFNIWIYDISNEEKNLVISNISQLISDSSKAYVDIFEDSLVYVKNMSIYSFNIITKDNSKILSHSKLDRILNPHSLNEYIRNEGIISDIKFYDDKIVYNEEYHERFKYSGTVSRCYDISKENNFELAIRADDIYENYVVGWASPFSGITDGDYELYLIDLNNR